MTQSWTQLVKERDFYKGRMEEESKRADRYWRERTDEIIRQRRVIAGLRGCVKRARVAKKPAAPAPRRST